MLKSNRYLVKQLTRFTLPMLQGIAILFSLMSYPVNIYAFKGNCRTFLTQSIKSEKDERTQALKALLKGDSRLSTEISDPTNYPFFTFEEFLPYVRFSHKAIKADRAGKVAILGSGGPVLASKMVMFKGDLMFEGFARSSGNKIDQNITTKEAFHGQPWLEWKEAEKSYKYHRRGAHKRILERLTQANPSGLVSLYRGTNHFQEKLLFLISSIIKAKTRAQVTEAGKTFSTLFFEAKKHYKVFKEDPGHFSKMMDHLKEKLQDIEKADWSSTENRSKIADQIIEAFWGENPIGFEFGSLFTTPNFKIAEGWSSGRALIKARVPINMITELNQAQQVYIGLEYKYIEVQFRGLNAVRLFAESLVSRD